MKLKWNPKAYLEREFYVGLFSLLLGIILITAPDRNTGLYRIYPRVVFGGLIVMGVLMVFYALFVRGGNNIARAKIFPFELLLLAVILISRPLIGTLGLYCSVFLVDLAVSLLIIQDKSAKGFLGTLVFNLVLIAVLYGVFALFLKVNAPNALLF